MAVLRVHSNSFHAEKSFTVSCPSKEYCYSWDLFSAGNIEFQRETARTRRN